MSSLNNPQLPALGILEPLGDDDRDILSGYGEFLPVQPGDALITQGSDQNGLYFVISGKMHASALRSGHNVLLGTINRGETIGEINLLDSDCASASVTAIDFTQVWHINDESLEDYINAYPKPAAWLLIGIGKTIAKRLRAANEKVATLFG